MGERERREGGMEGGMEGGIEGGMEGGGVREGRRGDGEQEKG